MSVAKRRFDDPRNTYIVDNNDPTAFDKRFAGKVGTHTEQRCCGDRAPYEEKVLTSYIRKVADVVDPRGLLPGARPRPGFVPPIGTVLPIADFYSKEYQGNWMNYDPVLNVWRQYDGKTEGYVLYAPGLKGIDNPFAGRTMQDIPPGWVDDGRRADPKLSIWWCNKCETYLEEQWAENWVPLGDELATLTRGIAMVVSYVPVFGTAIAFVLNAGVSLAEGKGLDEATLDAIGGALPGQPASGMAFNAARAIINGDRIDSIAIAALPSNIFPPAAKTAIKTAIEVVEKIADGQKITNIVLEQVYKELPPQGQKAMNIARRLCDGENVGDIAIQEIGEAATEAMRSAARAARAAGDEAVRSFVAQSGYQGLINTLPVEQRQGVTAGIMGGQAEKTKRFGRRNSDGTYGMSFNHGEITEFKATNDGYAKRGQAIINAGAKVRGTLIDGGVGELFSDIRNRYKTYKMVLPQFDALNNRDYEAEETATIDDDWRRGFDVGVGVCEGMTENGPGQRKIEVTLNALNAKRGFRMAQQLQYRRTIQNEHTKNLATYAAVVGRIVNGDERKDLMRLAWKGAGIATADPRVAAARRLVESGDYRWGFDIGTGLCQGMTAPGPGQDKYCSLIGPLFYNGGPRPEVRGTDASMKGFRVGQALQHGIAKSVNDLTLKKAAEATASAAAGALIAGGLAGSGTTERNKMDTIHLVTNDGMAAAGAAAVIKSKTSTLSRLKVWLFGN